jgi:hypothetical protein
MGMTLELPFDVVHTHEKSFEGQQHLDTNRRKFNVKAWDILLMMLDGMRLNHPECTNEKITLSLSSRISELRKSNYKVAVSKEWFKKDNKKVYKEYFLTDEEILRVRRLIISSLVFTKQIKQQP